MKKNRLKFLSVLTSLVLIIFVFNNCHNQTKNSTKAIIETEFGDKIDKKLSPYVLDMISSFDLPGLTIGIVRGNEIVYAKAFGYENITTKKPATIRSLYHMASISKPFVATAIIQLVEQGKISLDSTVLKYLPYFKLTGEHSEKITIRQMLNHTSGMPDEDDFEWDRPIYSEDAIEQYVRSIATEKMQNIPGETFAYSSMAFECLGEIIAKVSGMSFAAYEKKYILDPSGMEESTFLKPNHLPENWVAPHSRLISVKVWDGYPYNRRHAPSSTLHSNVIEMCNWAIMNLNRGSFKKKRVLNTSSYDSLWNPSFKIREKVYIGLSWFIDEYRGQKRIRHSGGDKGFNTNFIMLPESSIAVVVLCNIEPAPVERITDAVLDIMNGLEPKPLLIPAIIPFGKELEANGINAAVELWHSLKKSSFEKYDFEEDYLNDLGYQLLGLNRMDEAMKTFQLNMEEYPKSANVYDSLGDVLLANGDTIEALVNFKKAYEMDSSFTFSKKKIEEIERNIAYVN